MSYLGDTQSPMPSSDQETKRDDYTPSNQDYEPCDSTVEQSIAKEDSYFHHAISSMINQ